MPEFWGAIAQQISRAVTQPASVLPESVTAWARQAFGFVADPLQQPILDCNAARVIACTSRQVGKSTVAALRALYLALRYPRSLILMIGPVGSQAGEILEKAREFVTELGLPVRGDGVHRQSLRLPNGSRLIARPANAPASRPSSSPPNAKYTASYLMLRSISASSSPTASSY